MADNLLISLNAVVPFVFYVSAGYLVRRSGTADEGTMKKLNHLIFRVFFPFMMFSNIYSSEFALHSGMRLLFFSAASVLLLTAVLLLTVPRFVPENAKRGVMIQGIYRSNIVLFAIPLAGNVFGAAGTELATIPVAAVVPIYNVLAVIILEHFGHGGTRPGELLKNVLTNPLISGTILGFAAKGLHLSLPDCLWNPVQAFGALATPMALFVLGGTLYVSEIRKNMKYLVSILVIKLILLPALAIAVSVPAGFSPAERFVYFCVFATPVAASSFPMAQSMGGDGELAGQIVVLSTVCSVLTLFLWIFVLKTLALI